MTALAMEKKGSTKPVNTFVSLTLGKEFIEKLTPFDQLVLEAITTLFIDGANQYITNSMIYHVLVGDSKRPMSQNYANDITESITKLISTIVEIDATGESEMYPKLKDFKYKSPIVPGVMAEATLNAHKASCLKVLEFPPLFMYANFKNHISRVSLKLLAMPFAESGRETKSLLVLLHYLAKRIISIKNLSAFVNYESMYMYLHIEDEDPKRLKSKKFEVRKHSKKILDAWKNQMFGDIVFLGYEERKLGGIPVEIVLQYKKAKGVKSL